MKNRKDEGFTLIELLIVIVILGILATIVVFSVRGVTDQGQTNACKADKQTLEVATEAYFAKYGSAGGVTEQKIVDAGLLRTLSGNYTVSADGTSVTADNADCENLT